jgi:hypothetical protein
MLVFERKERDMAVHERISELGEALEKCLAEPVTILRVKGFFYQVKTAEHGDAVVPCNLVLCARSMDELAEVLAAEMEFTMQAKKHRILMPQHGSTGPGIGGN